MCKMIGEIIGKHNFGMGRYNNIMGIYDWYIGEKQSERELKNIYNKVNNELTNTHIYTLLNSKNNILMIKKLIILCVDEMCILFVNRLIISLISKIHAFLLFINICVASFFSKISLLFNRFKLFMCNFMKRSISDKLARLRADNYIAKRRIIVVNTQNDNNNEFKQLLAILKTIYKFILNLISFFFTQFILILKGAKYNVFGSNKKNKRPKKEIVEVIDFIKSPKLSEDFCCIKRTDLFVNFPLHDCFIVITDIIGSTALYNRNPRKMKGQIDKHDTAAMSHARKNLGHMVANEGDSFHFVFQYEYQAVDFAISFQEAISSLDLDFKVRIGINKGPMDVRKCSGYKCFGSTVDTCSNFIRHNVGKKICIPETVISKYNISIRPNFCVHK